MSKPAPMSLPPRQPVKGQAASSVASIEAQPLPEPADQPVVLTAPAPALDPAPAPVAPPLPPNVKALGGTVAVTVRMDQETYEKLKMFGVRTRQTNQTILLDAVKRVVA